MSIDSVIANKNLVRGFLKPIFYEEDGSLSAISNEDFAKVRDGYACGHCLAEYVMYLAKCPVCGHQRDIATDLKPTPELWTEHLLERQNTEGMESPAPRGFEEFMSGVNANPDIDKTTLKKLKPRRRA